jgi:hypothetical protein
VQQVMPGQVSIPGPHVRALPAPLSVAEIWPWALFGFVLLMLVYMVGVDQGATSLVPGSYVHELMHDGRHLLGFPCH